MKTIEIVVVLGLLSGVIYSLFGLGLVILYRTTNVVNFAQGDLATVGLYLGILLVDDKSPYWLTATVVILAGGVLSGVLGLLFRWHWFSRRTPVELVVATVGISLLIQGIEATVTAGNEYGFPSAGSATVFRLASVDISGADIASVGIVIILFALVGCVYHFTSFGKSMRAIAENEDEARGLGMRVGLMKNVSWFAAGLLAAVAALFAAPIYQVTNTSIDVLVIYGFAVVVVGGFESATGAAMVGIMVGMIQSIIGVYLSSTDVLPVIVGGMVIALLVAPKGILVRRQMERV